MLTGCQQPGAALRYNPAAMAGETATPRPAGALFDPPLLANGSAWGQQIVDGYDLNTRWQPTATNGYDLPSDSVVYQLRFYDRQLSHAHRDGGYLDRTFVYYRTGYTQR
jgi:hypothetical protein